MRTSFSIPPPPPPPAAQASKKSRRARLPDGAAGVRAVRAQSERVAECGSGSVVPVPAACASKVRVRHCAGALAQMYTYQGSCLNIVNMKAKLSM